MAGRFISRPWVVAIGVTALLVSVPRARADAASDAQKTDCAQFFPYSPRRDQLWNRIHRRLFNRVTFDGKILGCDELDPLLWKATTHVLAEPAYSETIALLDLFLNGHGERMVGDPLRRAIFQHDLWAFFDWLVEPLADPQSGPGPDPYRERRQQLAERVARMIRLVALNRAEIQHLPNNFDRLQRARGPEASPGLPDLALGWVLFGRDDGSIATPFHSTFISSRSVFFVFLKLPSGLPAVGYLNQLAAYSRKRKPKEDCFHKACSPPQFPAGTEVALVRRAMLIDADGDAALSPITESIQLRRYVDVPAVPRGYRETHRDFERNAARQRFAEFRWRRALLLRDESSLHELGARETAFEASRLSVQDFDYVEKYGDARGAPLRSCGGCHVGPGVISFMTYSQMLSETKFLAPRAATEIQEDAIARNYLQSTTSWKMLREMMTGNSNQAGYPAPRREAH